MRVKDLDGSRWTGTNKLWMEPTEPALDSPATLAFAGDTLRYTWDFKGKAHQGALQGLATGVRWSDSWHQSGGVDCLPFPSLGAPLLSVGYRYPAPPGPDWGWRIVLAQRPDDTMVLQMLNVTPWGEEALAVHIEATRQGD